MTAPVLSKTYFVQANVPSVDVTTAANISASAMLQYIGLLIGSAVGGTTSGTRDPTTLWTVRYSCNGVVAGVADDGVNHITTLADVVFSNNNSTTVAHSWIVLKNVALDMEILIDATVQGNNIRVVYAKSSTAAFSGGTTTASPTPSTADWFHASNGGTSISAFTGDVDNSVLSVAHYTHIVVSTSGFWIYQTWAGSGIIKHVTALVKTDGADVTDTHNVFSIWGATGNVAYIISGRSADASGTLQTSSGGILVPTYYCTGLTTGAVWLNRGVERYSSNYPWFPAYVADFVAPPSFRGTVPDLYSTSSPPNAGAVPAAANQQFVVWTYWIVPFPVINPIL